MTQMHDLIVSMAEATAEPTEMGIRVTVKAPGSEGATAVLITVEFDLDQPKALTTGLLELMPRIVDDLMNKISADLKESG